MGSDNPVKQLENFVKGSTKDLKDIVTNPFKPGFDNVELIKPAEPEEPAIEDQAAQAAQTRLKEDVKRRRASQTLFTGGMGLTDTPSTASSVLLGS